VHLAGKAAGGREVRLEGLTGATLVAEVLQRAAEAFGVPASAKPALRLDARVLWGEETLSEVGVPPEGDEVEMWVGEEGGMLGALDALQEQMSGFVSVLDQAVQQRQPYYPPVLTRTYPEEKRRALDDQVGATDDTCLLNLPNCLDASPRPHHHTFPFWRVR
jgi:hypothetical protein